MPNQLCSDDPDYFMCVYQHSTDILKALFSFLVDVRLYWTCVDAKQTARIYLVKKYKFVKRLSTTCFTMKGKGLCIIVSLYSIASCLVAGLRKTLQVATELTERCFVEHNIVSVLKSDFFMRNVI